MSFRTLPKLDLVTPLGQLADLIIFSSEYIFNRKRIILLELEKIEVEQKQLKDRLKKLSETNIAEQNLDASVPDLDQINLSELKINEITKLNNQIKRKNQSETFTDERLYITSRLLQIQARKLTIEKIQLPSLDKLLELEKEKINEGKKITDQLKELRDNIDSLFDKLEAAIKSVSPSPPLGPLIANILQIVIDTVNAVIFSPLILAISIFESTINLAENTFINTDENN
jgi:hypothetical protein